MNALQVFSYNSGSVSFKQEEGIIYVNATQMAKEFNKKPNDYLRLPSTNELISAIARKSHNCENQIVTTKQGSVESGGGTWMIEDLALDFAQWLSVDFKLWCNDRIKELMKHGMTATTETAERLLNDPDFLIETLTALKSERQQKEILLEQTRLQQREIELVQPKAQYYDNVLQSTSIYVADQIAKELGMTAVTMNRKLQDMNIMIRRNGQLVFNSKYAGRGYDKPKTYHYTKSDGAVGTNTMTVYTEKGREFLHSVFAR